MHEVSWFMIMIGLTACSIGVGVMFWRAAAADRKWDGWVWVPFPIAFPAVMVKILCQRKAIHQYRFELLAMVVGLAVVAAGLLIMP